MNSIPASSASCARRILFSQELTQRSGTFVTDMPPEQLDEKKPSFSALSFRIGDCLRPMDTSRDFLNARGHYDTTKCGESDGAERKRAIGVPARCIAGT